MSSPPSLIPLNYSALRQPLPKALLILSLLFCIGCPLAWFISADLVFLGPSVGWRFFPMQFPISVGLSILVPVFLVIQARVLLRREPPSAVFMSFAHFALAALAFWLVFILDHGSQIGDKDVKIVQSFLFAVGILEAICGVLHWTWATTLLNSPTGSTTCTADSSPDSRPSTWWRSFPSWIRWPAMAVGFVAIAYAEFMALFLLILLIS